MARASEHIITKLVNEPFFIDCADNLRDPDTGTQAATITSIDTIRLEKLDSKNPEKWSVAVPVGGFSSLQILAQGSISASRIAGILNADRDPVPPPGDYMFVAECTIQFVAGFGGGTAGKVFRREARIVAGSVTAP